MLACSILIHLVAFLQMVLVLVSTKCHRLTTKVARFEIMLRILMSFQIGMSSETLLASDTDVVRPASLSSRRKSIVADGWRDRRGLSLVGIGNT